MGRAGLQPPVPAAEDLGSRTRQELAHAKRSCEHRSTWAGHSGGTGAGIGARALLGSLPNVEWLLGDRGYDADWFRDALKDKGIRACIPGRKQRKTPVKYDKRRYKRRNRIEIMFECSTRLIQSDRQSC